MYFFKKKNTLQLLEEFSFDFRKLFLAEVSQKSERCFVNLFNGSLYDFGCYSFHFCSTLSDDLINVLLGNFIDVCRCFVDDAGVILPTRLTVSLPAYAKS